MGCFLLQYAWHTAQGYGLNPCCDGMFSILSEANEAEFVSVLILVVMGCFLLPTDMNTRFFQQRLNPCCDGMFSIVRSLSPAPTPLVLILVVMGCFLL